VNATAEKSQVERTAACFYLAAYLATSATLASPQNATLRGRVTMNGNPVAGAEVRIDGNPIKHSDEHGLVALMSQVDLSAPTMLRVHALCAAGIMRDFLVLDPVAIRNMLERDEIACLEIDAPIIPVQMRVTNWLDLEAEYRPKSASLRCSYALRSNDGGSLTFVEDAFESLQAKIVWHAAFNSDGIAEFLAPAAAPLVATFFPGKPIEMLDGVTEDLSLELRLTDNPAVDGILDVQWREVVPVGATVIVLVDEKGKQMRSTRTLGVCFKRDQGVPAPGATTVYADASGFFRVVGFDDCSLWCRREGSTGFCGELLAATELGDDRAALERLEPELKGRLMALKEGGTRVQVVFAEREYLTRLPSSSWKVDQAFAARLVDDDGRPVPCSWHRGHPDADPEAEAWVREVASIALPVALGDQQSQLWVRTFGSSFRFEIVDVRGASLAKLRPQPSEIILVD